MNNLIKVTINKHKGMLVYSKTTNHKQQKNIPVFFFQNKAELQSLQEILHHTSTRNLQP